MYRLQLSDINSQNIKFGLLRAYKSTLQRAGRSAGEGSTTIAMILGCQRSGTSLTYWIFERDLHARIFRESSELSSGDQVEHIRLNPLDDVNATFGESQVPLIVFKPLVESQRALELLDYFDDSRALWLYRHYQDVASSNLQAFGPDNGLNDLRPILANDQTNWRGQNTSPETREVVARFFAEDMNPHDAAALFWWARNQLFFEQGLDRNPNVMLCRYEDLVTAPATTMARVYDFLDTDYPGDAIVQSVHARSVGKGRKQLLSPEVDALCADLLSRLDKCYGNQLEGRMGEPETQAS